MLAYDSVNPHALLETLGVRPSTVDVMPGGMNTCVWRVCAGGEEFALRVLRPGEECIASLERDAMDAAAAAGIPVPSVRGITRWQGRPALLLTWCSGCTMGEAIMRHPWSLRSLSQSFGRVQKALHSVVAPQRVVQERDWIDLAGPGEEALKERLRAVAQGSPMLLHLDYHPFNVLVESGAVSSVIDWTSVSAGDPRCDYARTLALLRLAPLPSSRPTPLIHVMRSAIERGWRQGYGPLPEGDRDMPLFYAWAGAAMLRSLESKRGTELPWLQPRQLDPIRQWTAMWKRRADMPLRDAA